MAGYANNLKGKRFCIIGGANGWGTFMGVHDPGEHLRLRGADVTDELDNGLDYLVVGPSRFKGKAATVRKAKRVQEKGSAIEILDIPGLIHLVRPDISGERFAFAGGFAQGALTLETGPESLLTPYGAVVKPLSSDTTYFVVGERRAKGKTAALRLFDRLTADGAKITQLDEEAFLKLVVSQSNSADEEADFPTMVAQLRQVVDERRIERAIKMLKKERVKLFSHVDEERVMGIVKSQTTDANYACWIHADGNYGCHSDDSWQDDGDLHLYGCMGLQGKVCKHLIVLLMGLSRAGEITPATALRLARAAKGRKPRDDEDQAAEIHLAAKTYAGGSLDWRPTETVPEDFYLL